ncbi:MAG TPA: CHRD domain-containing protein [Methylomirabilota bacterium]|nr:CHRD domain-containing protein [Methylomirabilota bacterium]
MTRIWQISTAIGAFLLSVASAYAADVIANLENPPAEHAISGVSLVSGWAFTQDEEEDLTIYLRIDGVTQKELEIPCCSRRRDVDEAGIGAPDNTGFGLLVNYALLSAGPHTIGVDVRSSDFIDDITNNQDRRVIDHSVVIVRPGNTQFVNSVNLSGATCSIAPGGQEVVLNGVQLNSSTGSTTSDLRASYVTGLQSFVISSASGGPAVTQFVAHLNGSQENPRVQTSATGEATITLNANNSLSCTVTTTDLSDATAAHIHLAPAGQNGDIIIPLTPGPSASWTCPSTVLTAAQLDALQTARLYMNIHTPDHPNGEVRGQIVAAPL